MGEASTTKDRLLQAAKDLFWTRGYSNVSVRDVTRAAGVDAALVSRYFGGKRGLFEATLTTIPAWEPLSVDGDALLAAAAASFAHPYDPDADAANPFSMLLSNVIDPEMGPAIRELVRTGLAAPLAEKIGGENAERRAAALLALLFGVALLRKNFQVPGLAEMAPDDLARMIERLGAAALEDGGAP